MRPETMAVQSGYEVDPDDEVRSSADYQPSRMPSIAPTMERPCSILRSGDFDTPDQ